MGAAIRQSGVPWASFGLAVALAWAAGPAAGAGALRQSASSTNSCTVTIAGETEICSDEPATYTATGTPAGGTCTWKLVDSPGATIVSTDGCSVKVQANATAASFKLKVKYEAEGKTCTDTLKVEVVELIRIPVCVRLLKDSTGTKGTAQTADGVAAALAQANAIWKKCCIRFETAMVDGKPKTTTVNTPPGQDALAQSIHVESLPGGGSESPGFLTVNAIGHHKKCVNLVFVRKLSGQGFTMPPQYPADRTQPPTGLDGAGTGVDDKANANTLAHEFGHQLGLPHSGNPANLMSRGASGSNLTKKQCEFARTSAKLLLQALAAQ